MHIRKFEIFNNSLILYTNNLFLIDTVYLNENLKSCTPNSFHTFLLNNFPNGWYALLKIGEEQFLLNDFISSNRVYFNPILSKWSSSFWDLEVLNFNQEILNEVVFRGYTTGDQTVSENIFKVLPCSILNLQTFKQNLNHNDIFKISENISFDISKYLNFNELNSKKVGVAFSGGLDSTFIASELIRNGIKPTLYFIDNEIDDDRFISLKQAEYISNKLNLPLQKIIITKNEIELGLHKFAYDYPNDLSIGFVAIKLLLEKIQHNTEFLLTGQNSDTFLTFGLSRPYHFVETLTRILYSTAFKKIFHNHSISIFDKLLLMFVYKLRGYNKLSIPKNKNELLNGFANEKFYLPIYSENATFGTNIDHYAGLNYYNSVVVNKLINHIAGNHSLVWSNCNDPIVLMPFGHIDFMRFSITRYGRILHILNPKAILQSRLNFKFKRINNKILTRLSRYFFSSQNESKKIDFKIHHILNNLSSK